MCQRNRYMPLRAFKACPIIKLAISQGNQLLFKNFPILQDKLSIVIDRHPLWPVWETHFTKKEQEPSSVLD